MREYTTVGASPCDEECVQIGDENYTTRARAECARFIARIREVLGQEPIGAKLAIKGFSHDYGTYYEVVCYHDDSEAAIDYAYKCEGESPTTWN